MLPLYQQLKSRSVDVWVDQEDIPKGMDWDRAIDDALARCSCFVIILTPISVASEEVRAELRTAYDLGKPIVPVLLRSCEIPRRLRLRQFVDVSSPLAVMSETANRILRAVNEALEGHVEHSASSRAQIHQVQSLLGTWRVWIRQRAFYLLAVSFPPLAFATAHLVRLPVEAEYTQNYIAFAAAAVCLLALWISNRTASVLCAACVGVALVLKPLMVPIEGFVDGQTFPYDSAVARLYWFPGALLIVLAAVITAVSNLPRLAKDFRSLRPNGTALTLTLVIALASWWHFSQPTLYDVYLPFRLRYQVIREHLKSIADTVDRVKEPFAPKQHPEPPLVIDGNSQHVRNDDPSTTGHFFLYQHLREPDKYFGDIEYAFNDNLHLNLRDTGTEPELYAPAFANFASNIHLDQNNLQRVADAPYIVIVKPLALDASKRVDSANIALVGPYRVLLYNLQRDEIVLALDVQTKMTSFDELKAAVTRLLETTAGARILK